MGATSIASEGQEHKAIEGSAASNVKATLNLKVIKFFIKHNHIKLIPRYISEINTLYKKYIINIFHIIEQSAEDYPCPDHL